MKLYNTLTATKEDLVVENNSITMYVCGPNLYGPCHLGHGLSYVFFDTLRRYLEHQGYAILHVQNFTDIEDRIIQTSHETGEAITNLAEYYIHRFLTEMDGLNIQRAHHYPKATEAIPQIITIITDLISKGYAYATEIGDVFFRVRKSPNYGALSNRSPDTMRSGSRIEIDPNKDDPLDFALWKSAKEGEPFWDSPWGNGRPGWHIECSAMVTQIIGNQVDIHGGGQDVIFPHHENEIVQSESYSGVSPFARYWIHNGLLSLSEGDSEKMTRHQGNFVSCQEALAAYPADVIRLYLLSSHYRTPLAYNENSLVANQRAIGRLRRAAFPEDATVPEMVSDIDTEGYYATFSAAMDDDMNTPEAIATIFELGHAINRDIDSGKNVSTQSKVLQSLAGILGLSLESKQTNNLNTTADALIEILIELRTTLRGQRQYETADIVRTKLEDLGIALHDSKTGTTWTTLDLI
jgi:cysteinyl-tRNA synthetase